MRMDRNLPETLRQKFVPAPTISRCPCGACPQGKCRRQRVDRAVLTFVRRSCRRGYQGARSNREIDRSCPWMAGTSLLATRPASLSGSSSATARPDKA
jgi:hypothetical protein